MSEFVLIAALGWKALLLMYIWLGSAIVASMLSRSKGYGEKPGLGTGMLLTILGPIIWLFVPPKDENAEWHTRKPWQRRHKPTEDENAEWHTRKPWQRRHKPTEAEMSGLENTTTSGTGAADGGTAGAGSRGGESRG